MWKVYAILSAFFAALTAILAKTGIRGIPGETATAVRTVVVLVFAWTIVLLNGQVRRLGELESRNWAFLVFSGVATGLSWLFYMKALETGDVSKVAAIDKLSVAIAIGLAFVVLREPVDAKTLAGAALIVAGTFVLIY